MSASATSRISQRTRVDAVVEDRKLSGISGFASSLQSQSHPLPTSWSTPSAALLRPLEELLSWPPSRPPDERFHGQEGERWRGPRAAPPLQLPPLTNLSPSRLSLSSVDSGESAQDAEARGRRCVPTDAMGRGGAAPPVGVFQMGEKAWGG
jgi:hypothetical protein